MLDASAVLAILQREAGSEKLTAELLAESVISTVNLAEVQSMLVRGGGTPEQAWTDAIGPAERVAPFTIEQARVAGNLVARTRSNGL